MPTTIERLLTTVASLATACSVAGISGTALAEKPRAEAPVPVVERAQWRSALIDTRDIHHDPEWKSTLGMIEAVDTTDPDAARSPVGLRHAPRYGFQFPMESVYLAMPEDAAGSMRTASESRSYSKDPAR